MLICIEQVLNPEEVAQCLTDLSQAMWQDGKRTAGQLAAQVKCNRQTPHDCPWAIRARQLILSKLWAHEEWISAALPAQVLTPRFNCYRNGGHYGLHVDSAFMHDPIQNLHLRCDWSCTLFLSDAQSYDGGELQIETAFGLQSVKLNAGDLVLYPANSLHQVTPVTLGQRLACFFWVQSRVQNGGIRQALYDLDQSIRHLKARGEADSSTVLQLVSVYHNLLREVGQA